jgi:ubiquinone biosynthesis protein
MYHRGMAPTPLPLPDPRDLVATSAWVGGMPWLREEAAIWQRELPPVRARLEREAALLARPRVWVDTVATLATTGWRMASTAAPDAPLQILTAAAGAFGLPVGPTQSGAGVRTAEQLVRAGGPAYVKLGQFISSADGLLPREWVKAFAWCRDRVPPVPGEVAIARIRAELGERFDELSDLEPEAFAAASIGQVHRARLADGTDVVVKVRRPHLRRQFAQDVEALALVAAAAHRLSAPRTGPFGSSAGWMPAGGSSLRVANLPGFVELFAQLALLELDFRIEALNMVELGACFEDAGLEYCAFPRPIPGMVTERVLVMEAVPGVPFSEAAATYGSALDGDRLLDLAIKGVLEGTLIYGRFHGDMHAGNVLVEGGDRFSLVDFGICGRLTAGERAGLVRFLLGFAAMDAERQLDALDAFGALPPEADRAAMAAALQQVIDDLPPGLTVDALGETLGGVLRVLAAHGFQAPKELVLFFKNVLYLSSFTAAVAPDADLLAQIGPVLAYFTEKYGDELFSLAV